MDRIGARHGSAPDILPPDRVRRATKDQAEDDQPTPVDADRHGYPQARWAAVVSATRSPWPLRTPEWSGTASVGFHARARSRAEPSSSAEHHHHGERDHRGWRVSPGPEGRGKPPPPPAKNGFPWQVAVFLMLLLALNVWLVSGVSPEPERVRVP